jgi:PAS domain S-box-containing protein
VVGNVAELAVRDTGIGIRETDLQHLFERFHRVEGARGRTMEGSGIGLALIQELVKLHGGSVRVESQYGKGSHFIISVPLGTAHLPADRLGSPRSQQSTAISARAYVEEALRWLPESAGDSRETFEIPPLPAHPSQKDAEAAVRAGAPRARVLIADDNADMREYLRRLLGVRFDVEAASDGEEALRAINRSAPDLLLADIMMPRLDGFGLIRAIRSNPATAMLPIVLLSARAGEEARIEGLHTGADDYLVKPFSARELLARVTSRLEIARVRSEAAQNERELRLIAEAERQRFYNLLNEAPALIAVLRGADHVFELVNTDYLRAVGRPSRTSIVGKRVIEALPELAGQGYVELLDNVYRTGESHFGSERLARLDLRGDGILEDRYFNFVYQPLKDLAGTVEGILVHAVDVTEEVLARRRIEESESRFRHLADSMPQIVWTADAQGECDYFNRRWYDFVGMVWPDRHEPRWDDVLHPDDAGPWRQCWNDAVRAGSVFQMECRLYDQASGAYRWHLARAVPAVEGKSRAVRWYGTCTDVQDQKQTEEIIRQKQRLESTGLLAGGIAHDFNNLLTGVLGNATLLLEEEYFAKSARAMLQDIVSSAERAAHLTRQMLAYAGKGSFLFEHLDLSEEIRRTERLLRAAVPKKVQLRLALADDLPLVEADVAQVDQVVMNLVINAAEAIGAERPGWVTVTTRAETVDSTISGSFLPEPPPPGPYAVLEVHDDGSGMTPDVAAKIFDPFFTTKFTGRGLGLSAVLGIVKSHRGAMLFESSAGKGSTFRVFFPAVAGQRAVAGRAGPARAVCPTILVIDDEEVVRRTVRHAFESHGYSVVEASNGEEGLKFFQANSAKYQLILLDLTMPVMGGEEALRYIRAIRPDVPIILSSGYDERVATSRFSGLRLSGFIQKPYTTSALISLAVQVLENRGARESKTDCAGNYS